MTDLIVCDADCTDAECAGACTAASLETLETTTVPATLPDRNHTPWPVVVLAVVAAFLLVFAALAKGVSSDRKVFVVLVVALWTAIWLLVLWGLWRAGDRALSWWMLLLAVAAAVVFTVALLGFKVGV